MSKDTKDVIEQAKLINDTMHTLFDKHNFVLLCEVGMFSSGEDVPIMLAAAMKVSPKLREIIAKTMQLYLVELSDIDKSELGIFGAIPKN